MPRANLPGADFPLQNLPLGVFRASSQDRPRIGVAIGERVLDLGGAVESGLLELPGRLATACQGATLNGLMAEPAERRHDLRMALSEALLEGSRFSQDRTLQDKLLRAQSEVQLLLPAMIGDYTDFYASVFHASNVGSMFRPDNPLLPNYKWVPIGYHGRASSVVVSGTPVRRPAGQSRAPDAAAPSFGPSRMLDYQSEAVDLGLLLDGLTRARNALNLIILDACRNNPFGPDFRSDDRGLSQLDAPPGTFLAYATAPGNTAEDGEGSHGLYTDRLLQEMLIPGAAVEDVFKRVRLAVRKTSQGEQIPWESTSLEADFSFLPGQSTRDTAKEFESDLASWQQLRSGGSPDQLEAFIRQRPNGKFNLGTHAQHRALIENPSM